MAMTKYQVRCVSKNGSHAIGHNSQRKEDFTCSEIASTLQNVSLFALMSSSVISLRGDAIKSIMAWS